MFVAIASYPAAAIAGAGAPVEFVLHNVPGTHAGSWTSSGAVVDSGSWGAVGDFCVGGPSAPTFTCHFPDLILDGNDLLDHRRLLDGADDARPDRTDLAASDDRHTLGPVTGLSVSADSGDDAARARRWAVS
jgi:hypothetical protein